MLVSGPPLSIAGGHCDTNLLPFEWHVQNEGVADGVEAVQHKTREIIKYGTDLIKICATGGGAVHGGLLQHSPEALQGKQAIASAAHRLRPQLPATGRAAAGRRA